MPTNAELTEDLIDLLRDYYREDVGQLAERYPHDQRSLYVDYGDVYRFDPDIADDVLSHPERMREHFEEALTLYDIPVAVDLSDAHVRFHNLPETHTVDAGGASRHENIGSLLDIRGQVQKLSDVKPRLVKGVFECQRCGTQTTVEQHGESIQKPHECEGCERQGPFSLDQKASTLTNHQYARLQQPPETTKGGDAPHIGVHLEDDLIEELEAGDRVTLTGTLDLEELGDDQSRNFNTSVDGQAVVTEESDYEDINVDEYREEIEAIANGERGDPYDLIVDSVNPEHYGDEDVKLAIGLQLFGGWSKSENSNFRGDSHILLMGDPGCGKSTFLSEIDKIAPRSTYASGKGASASGLTAAAVNDDFGDTEWGLEAGALVLADGGVACIDEIDKVSGDAVSSLHDALESQKVRVNKAGINATLNARTAMLAAGNPEEGRFNTYRPRAEQLDMSPTLLSRFDLMFMVSDTPDAEQDRAVVDHMMRTHRASAKKALGEELTEEEKESIDPAIPYEVLRAYIAYAKEECKPYLDDDAEARQYLREEFLKLRLANKDDDSDSPVPVTFRQEEAIERLAEASARIRLDDKVRKQDVDRTLSLVKKSMKQVGVDPESGELDADIIETGQSKSQRDRRETIVVVLDDLGGATLDELAETVTADSEQLEHDVQHLKDKGRVYEMDGELRKA